MLKSVKFLFLIGALILSTDAFAHYKWVKSVNGTFQGTGLSGDHIRGKSVVLCAGQMGDALYIGNYSSKEKACVFAYNNGAQKSSEFYIFQVDHRELYPYTAHWNVGENGNLPQFPGGYPISLGTIKGQTAYICRLAFHFGDPEKELIYAGTLYDGKCHYLDTERNYQTSTIFSVLGTKAIPVDTWTAGSNGGMESGTHVTAGEWNKTPLYLCAAYRDDSYHPGKLVGQHCVIGLNGQEVREPEYYTLKMSTTLPPNVRYAWENSPNGQLPQREHFQPMPLGKHNGKPMFICRVQNAQGIFPGKMIGNQCYYPFQGKEEVTQPGAPFQVMMAR